MIKKKAAIFFILLANILLSAHAVIPHHHHDSEICVTTVHSHDDCEDHNHDSAEHKHEHEGEQNSECCTITPIVVIPSNQVKHECKCFDCLDKHSSIDYQTALFNSASETFVPILITNTRVPGISSSYTQSVYTAIGLRAPPIV